jgi:hypothetical protein
MCSFGDAEEMSLTLFLNTFGSSTRVKRRTKATPRNTAQYGIGITTHSMDKQTKTLG